MLKKILLGLGVIIIALVILIATRPATFQVERIIAISAPANVIFSKINDFHEWAAWSPWEKLDPNMKKIYEGPQAGLKSSYSWVGNKDVGKGKMTILESQPNEKVVVQLEFLEPWAATNTTTFLITPKIQGTYIVTWRMEGHHNFIGKAFSLFMNMDKMVGKDFDTGLNNLKIITEKNTALP